MKDILTASTRSWAG